MTFEVNFKHLLIVALILGGFVAGLALPAFFKRDRPTPGPEPVPPAPRVDQELVELGKQYQGVLARARADGWRAEAEAIERGQSPSEAQEIGQETFLANRSAEFERLISPKLRAIHPEGDPLDTLSRSKLAQAFRDLAFGLDGRKEAPEPFVPLALDHPTGWIDDPSARQALARTLPAETLSIAAPQLFNVNTDKEDVFLYKAWKDALGEYPDYFAQQIGDCTGFGAGRALDLIQCINIILDGSDKSKYDEVSTEVVYGFGREVAGLLGRSGDGGYGVAVAKGLTTMGVLPRSVVGPYSGNRAREFGYRGVPADLKAKAKEFLVKEATLVTTLDEADAALRNGYPFIVCSMQGFTMTRDRDGLCEASGRWAHCMLVAGLRHRGGERQYLLVQSWGRNVPSGPTVDDQPDYSFWIRGGVLSRMLQARDSLAFSGFDGFHERDLPDAWKYSGSARPAWGSRLPVKPAARMAASNPSPN